MSIFLTITAILITLYLLDKLCLWLESRGLLYYRHKKAEAGFLASTLENMNSFLNPSVRHTIEMKQNQVKEERQTAGDGSNI